MGEGRKVKNARVLEGRRHQEKDIASGVTTSGGDAKFAEEPKDKEKTKKRR